MIVVLMVTYFMLILPRIAGRRICCIFFVGIICLIFARLKRIVNGRWNDDRGNFTCMTYNGQSVVDYLITCWDNFCLLKYFWVEEFNMFSNLAPLAFSFSKNMIPTNDSLREGTNCRWNDKFKDQFLSDITKDIHMLENSSHGEISKDGSVDLLTNILTDFLGSRGQKYFQRKVTSRVFFTNTKSNKDWYDSKYETKYLACKNAIRQYNLTLSTEDRSAVLNAKKDYRYLCRTSKLQFNRQRCKNMNALRRKSPKEFWKIFSNKTCDSSSGCISTQEFKNYFESLMSNMDVEVDE